jgi:hypothetical protein
VHDYNRGVTARHALAKSGSIVSIAAMRLASFFAISVWSQLDMITASTLKDPKPRLPEVGIWEVEWSDSGRVMGYSDIADRSVLSARLCSVRPGRHGSKAVTLRHPVMPVANGLGSGLVGINGNQL